MKTGIWHVILVGIDLEVHTVVWRPLANVFENYRRIFQNDPV